MIMLIKFFLAYFFKFSRLNKNVMIFNSTVNLFYNFNSKTLFEYCLREYSDKYICKFVIDDPDLRKNLILELGDHFIGSKSIKDIIYILKAKTWVTSTIDIPIISLAVNKNRVVYHLGHGVPLKNIILAEDCSFLRKLNRYIRTRGFSHVLCYSDEFSGVMRNSFKNNKINYVPLGQPRNDKLGESIDKHQTYLKIKDKLPELPEHTRAILYAPTWRESSPVKFFPFDMIIPEELNEILIERNTVLYLRKHPYYGCQIDEKYLHQSNIVWFNSDKFNDVMEYLGYFDKLITDYSSIYLDYLCLDRPIGFIPYDLELYAKTVGFSYDYEKLFCGENLLKKEDFFSFLVSEEDCRQVERHSVINLINAKSFGNCRENMCFLERIINE